MVIVKLDIHEHKRELEMETYLNRKCQLVVYAVFHHQLILGLVASNFISKM